MSENGPDRDAALAVIDEALASGRVTATDDDERELQDLALAIEAESELPREEFARELGERVAAGFPRRRRRALAIPRGRGLALAGAAATLVLVVGVALSVSGGEERQVGDAFEAGPQATDGGGTTVETAPAPENPAAAQVEPRDLQSRARVAPGEQQRRIERSAELTLAAPEDRLDGVADSIVGVTDRHQGFVLSSNVSSGEDSERGGSFELRVPADRLQVALRDLSRLGHVRARRQAGRDITPAYVSSRDRLTTAKAERRSLLRRLAAADTDAETEALRRSLDAVALRIDRARRELGAVRERSNYAAVGVTLEAEDGDGGSGGAGGTRDALDDSLGLLSGALNLALRALGVLIPLAIVGGLGWLAGNVLRRRRREAALR
jgi:hypothetical protein